MIYIVPELGLCNRIRVVESAISLATLRQDDLIILWKVNSDLGARFEDLFNPIELLNIKVRVVNIFTSFNSIGFLNKFTCGIDKLFRPENIKQEDISKADALKAYDKMALDFFEGKDSYYKYKGDIESFWLRKRKKSLFINTYSRFCGSFVSNFSAFEISREVQLLFNSINHDFNNYTLGIHIRRTDNKEAINKSTTEKFVKAIDLEMSNGVEKKIYLATDSIDEKKYFMDRYGDKIITIEMNLNRFDVKGMQYALLDLYCLSLCSKLIGSYFSSFTEVSVSYNRIKDYLIIN